MSPNPYTKELTPIVSEFLRLTRMENMKWQRLESGVYQTSLTNTPQRIQVIRSDNPISLYYGIKFFQDDVCEFDYYTDEGHQSAFDALLANLYEAAEITNAKHVKQLFDEFLNHFKNI